MIKRIKNMVVFAIAMLPMALGAQTQTENYVVSKTYKKARTTKVVGNHVDSVSTAIQYFDGLGRAKQSVLVKGGSGFGNNQFPYDWSIGNPDNNGFYNLNGTSSENQIISGTTPFGDTDLLWECVNDASSGPDGGWVTDYLTVDTTKAYRYTVWVKKTGNMTDGYTYHGVGWSDVKNLSGSVNVNPYFWAARLPQADTWYLMVGYVHPSDYTEGELGLSGVYDINGNKVLDGLEFKWNDTISQARFRNYLYYATDTNTRQYFWSPLVQKIDGSETSLDDLIATSTVFNNQEIDTKDIVTHYKYDDYGRQTKDYLPYVSAGNSGGINTNVEAEIHNYYKTNYASDFTGIAEANINPYSEKELEASPLNRVFKQAAPGEDWKLGNGHEIELEYTSNDLNEVRLYKVTLDSNYTPTLIGAISYYLPSELTKTITKDENHTSGKNRTTEEFKNLQGLVVLKRTYALAGTLTPQAHDTYYVYDDYGNLTYVLPPEASDQTIDGVVLNELCYQYKYDSRNRLAEKKIPGKGWEYIVYDNLDRPVLTQDALQRGSNKWLFTKYDILGRVIYTGLYLNTSDTTREAMQTTFSNANDLATELYENKAGSLSNLGINYYNNNFPKYNVEVLTVNYYDSYVDLPTGFIVPTTNYYGTAITTNTKGLSTVNKTKVLTTNDWITTVSYYDHKVRPIYIYSQNDYLGTTDIIESKLDDFTGRVEETKTTHKKIGKPDLVTIDRFEYDHQDRLINQTQKVNDQFSERLVRNNYDDLGQLKSKLTGNGVQKGFTSVSSGITITDDLITKTSTSNVWNVGLRSLGSFNSDGYVEFSSPLFGKLLVVGLGNTNPDVGFFSMEHAMYVHASNIFIYESGINKGAKSTYQAGDTFRVERMGNTIYYKKNGEVIYVSETTSSGNLFADVSMFSSGGQIKNLHIVDNSKGLQNVDYTYNVRGWLKNINQDAQNDNDLFNFSLRYNDPTSGTALYNGNISQTSWNTLNTDSSTKTYTYSYDALNRILSGVDNAETYILASVNYDKNGNILNLQRYGHTNANATTFGMMDNLTYTYDSGNKLVKVADAAPIDQFGFKDDAVNTTTDISNDYTYDANGNMITDENKVITSITYNHLNLPVKVVFNNQDPAFSSSPKAIEYVYSADGVKLEKKVWDSSLSTTNTVYAGNHIYKNDNLQFFNHAEGYAKYENGSFDYVYQYKDHLGNVRLSYNDKNGDGIIDPNKTEIVEESNYYPFGLKHKGYNNATSPNGNSTAQKFGFGGKELNEELGLNWGDFGARNYDASLGRWMNLDPLSEKYTNLSPYSYVANNVVNAIDPDGRLIIYISGLLTNRGSYDQKPGARISSHYSTDVIDRGNPYWSTSENSYGVSANLVDLFNGFHNDKKNLFVSGSDSYSSSAVRRKTNGRKNGSEFHKMVQMGRVKLDPNEPIIIVSHSQGGAHAAGYAEQLMTYTDKNGKSLYNVKVIYYITPHQGKDILNPFGLKAFQFSHPGDAISGEGYGVYDFFNGGKRYGRIDNVDLDSFFEEDIMGEGESRNCGGTIGNRCGHNATDNVNFLIKTLKDFCRNNAGKCKEISLDPNKGGE